MYIFMLLNVVPNKIFLQFTDKYAIKLLCNRISSLFRFFRSRLFIANDHASILCLVYINKEGHCEIIQGAVLKWLGAKPFFLDL